MTDADLAFVSTRRLAASLLIGIADRGRDATGAAWVNPSGTVQVQKRDVAVGEFIKNLSIAKRAKSCILHTRAWTQGDPKNNANNHPILSGAMVGVHNGMVDNDTGLRLAHDLNYQAEVDSEAIFAMLDLKRNEGIAGRIAALEAIRGSMAIAWFDTRDTSALNLARGDSSPLVMAQTTNGSLLFGSTFQVVEDAAAENSLALEWTYMAKEGMTFTVVEGAVIETQPFKEQGSAWGRTWQTSAKSYTSSKWAGMAEVTEEGNNLGDTWDDDYYPAAEGYVTTDYFDPDIRPMWRGYFAAYADREDSIDRWVDAYRRTAASDPTDDAEAWAKARVLGSRLRPGDPVMVELLGHEYEGFIIDLPMTFPSGDYIIGIEVPHSTRVGQTEVIYVRRARGGFDLKLKPGAGVFNTPSSTVKELTVTTSEGEVKALA